jgi:hypothetical protein
MIDGAVNFFTRPNSLSAAVLWVLDLMNVAAAGISLGMAVEKKGI